MEKYLKELVGIDTGNDLLNESIYNYLIYGLPPGSFTKAVLENNLYAAANSADHNNYENLSFIAQQIGISMPMMAWGSPKKVKRWMSDEAGLRSKYGDGLLEKATMMKLEDV